MSTENLELENLFSEFRQAGMSSREAKQHAQKIVDEFASLRDQLARAQNSDEHNFQRWIATQLQAKTLRDALESAKDTIKWVHGCTSPADDEVEKAIEEAEKALATTINTTEIDALVKDAERWRDLVSHQKFNNKPQVGYAINRTIERVDASLKEVKVT